ncbi:MAG: diphthamide synthesis protein [Nanoarchaeota archaeon]
MKIVHILAKSKLDIDIPKEVLEQIPPNLGVVTSIQHLGKVRDIAQQIKGRLAGQVLGCRTESANRFVESVDGYLFIGTGRFHPIAVALSTRKEVWCYNPVNKQLSKIAKDEIDGFVRHRKAAIVNFFAAKRIGILVSTKSGQNLFKKALDFKENRKDDGKEYYIFAFETLFLPWLEHFPFVQCWVNTACPRIADDTSGIANIDDIVQFEKDGEF